MAKPKKGKKDKKDKAKQTKNASNGDVTTSADNSEWGENGYCFTSLGYNNNMLSDQKLLRAIGNKAWLHHKMVKLDRSERQ